MQIQPFIEQSVDGAGRSALNRRSVDSAVFVHVNNIDPLEFLRRDRKVASRAPDAAEVAKVAETLSSVEDEELRAALARLGASIKRN